MEKVRTTIVLESRVFKKLKQETGRNISAYINKVLKDSLFQKESLFGVLKGRISTKDIIEEEIHEDLYS
jgi:hypothetical protein